MSIQQIGCKDLSFIADFGLLRSEIVQKGGLMFHVLSYNLYIIKY